MPARVQPVARGLWLAGETDASYAEPHGILDGQPALLAVASGQAAWLAGGPLAFALVRIGGAFYPVAQVDPAILVPLSASPSGWAGLDSARPWVMGILNVTPDSFSDGGDHRDAGVAIAAGLAMAEAGADVVDVGGESTRPGAAAVSVAEEQARVVPVIRELAGQGVRVSVDTRNAATMRAALEAGAAIVNDVSALAYDPEAARVVADAGCPVVLMHMRHTPADMIALAKYDDVALEVARELAARVAAAEAAGVSRDRIAVDPGIGFAKNAAHNRDLLPRIGGLLGLGRPLVVGVSRKRMIGTLSGEADPKQRVAGSIAAALHAVMHGAAMLRVHDVAATVQALRIWQGLTATV